MNHSCPTDTRKVSQRAPVCSGGPDSVRRGWSVIGWGVVRGFKYQLTSLYELVVLDCAPRRPFYDLPVPKRPLVKHASTKLDAVLLVIGSLANACFCCFAFLRLQFHV